MREMRTASADAFMNANGEQSDTNSYVNQIDNVQTIDTWREKNNETQK